MVEINSDAVFKETLMGLDPVDARIMGAAFVDSVVALADDQRLRRLIDVASSRDAVPDELAASLKMAKSIMVESYTRCGADGDWNDQAGYFVARAAVACLSPVEKGKPGGPAWQAAMSSRMARTSAAIVSGNGTIDETEEQYRMLTDFLTAREKETS